MKTLMTILLTLSFGSSLAVAQGTSNTKLRKPAPPTYNYDPDTYVSEFIPTPYMVDGFNIGFEYLSVNSAERDVKSKVTGTLQRDLQQDTEDFAKQVGVKVGYKQVPRGGMGFDLNLSILKADRRQSEMGDLTYFDPSANFVLAAPRFFYGALGLNTSVVAGSNIAKYTPRLGYQVGAGVILGPNFNLEVFYNWINMAVEEQYAMSEVRTTATNARVIYAF